MWIAIPEDEKDESRLWGVFYEATDCHGTKGYVGMIADGLLEEEARLIAQRLNA